ncbi:MAG: T9SS type A sorting domain-containing protein [Chitinophagaceae bacterium]|nr:T9SS type A sorting domain-containing protein [Chitinophagaceae bacterium]
MKKILSTLFLVLAALGIALTGKTQCVVTNLGVNLKSYNPATCHVVFDLSWEQEVNNGNKYAYVHLWTSANYHTPAANWATMYSNPAAYPKAADLINALATIAIFDNGTATPFIGTKYPPDELFVIPLTAGLSVVKTPLTGGLRERMTIFNIDLVLGSCTDVIAVKGDVWASQASNGKNVHCASQGLSFNLNNPRVIGFKVCEPRSVTFGITNNDPATAIKVYYNLYKDDGDNIFEPGVGTHLDGDPILTSADIDIAPLATYAVTRMSYPGNDLPGESGSLWIEVITKVPVYSFAMISELLDPGCVPLPVQLTSFSAERNGATVLLKWTTATEINCKGFRIERKTGNGWITAGFVNSAALNGMSTEKLDYQYTDLNNVKGLSQYRIVQEDLDGRLAYSEIRSVPGEGHSNMLVYPNPSQNGTFNIVFSGQNTRRDILILDMNGRCIRQIKNSSDNTVVLRNIPQGLFLLRIIDLETREMLVQKIMVGK